MGFLLCADFKLQHLNKIKNRLAQYSVQFSILNFLTENMSFYF